ncbi:hypothetical protein K402DRAFT_210943 [Aulographum hederae CBS 113979]|uniref:Uncharacterized protein n=1 Tax=Aulographum hederae CBS 113979 TaxID=1176131 RepID=A0A6G1GMP7_9PEZI|nr:hypothetical protein K402DRAFT_210943 [Aulographum hederae CBS 113979]
MRLTGASSRQRHCDRPSSIARDLKPVRISRQQGTASTDAGCSGGIRDRYALSQETMDNDSLSHVVGDARKSWWPEVERPCGLDYGIDRADESAMVRRGSGSGKLPRRSSSSRPRAAARSSTFKQRLPPSQLSPTLQHTPSTPFTPFRHQRSLYTKSAGFIYLQDGLVARPRPYRPLTAPASFESSSTPVTSHMGRA